MSDVAAKKDSAQSGADMPFETALAKLESIVEAMESQDLALENLLLNYEQGCQMAALCQAKLAEAELKIQQLERKSNGNLTLKPITLSDSNSE